jgi:hypothetical protein
MAAPPRPTDLQKQLVSQLLHEDAELRGLARQLVKAGMSELVNQLHRGDAQTRAAIARSMAGAFTRPIFETGDDDTDSDLRAEMHQMMGELRGDLMPDEEPDTAALASIDGLVPKSL